MSANSGEEIYNKVVVEGEGPDGSPVRVTRYAGQQPGAPGIRIGPTNPGFETNLNGWTTIPGQTAPTRVTTNSNTGIASMRLSTLAPSGAYTDVPGTFTKGRVYRLTLFTNADVPGTNGAPIQILFGGGVAANGSGGDKAELILPTLTGETGSFFLRRDLIWVPASDFTSARVWISYPVAQTTVWLIDDVRVEEVRATMVDRRGFARAKVLPVQSKLTETAATQLADMYLRGHLTTPTKGSLTHPGGGAVQTMAGEPIPPSELGLYTGELIRLGHLIDPDTGALGRDGRLVGGEYRHAERKFEAQIDNRRGNFEAFLERLAVVTGAKGVR
jgi:hypothetical protein